jgi:hypothetical protein
LPESDMFRSSEEVLAEAYHLQEERIAYQTKSAAVAASVSSRSATG